MPCAGREIKSQKRCGGWRSGAFFIQDRRPGNRHFTVPTRIRRARIIANDGSIERLPSRIARAAIGLAFDPYAAVRLADDVQHGSRLIVGKNGLNEQFAQVFAPGPALLIVHGVLRVLGLAGIVVQSEGNVKALRGPRRGNRRIGRGQLQFLPLKRAGRSSIFTIGPFWMMSSLPQS